MGDVLVGHPRTRFIAFTGSKEVGLRINELAAKTAPGQIWIKRVVAEMGGKDAIVVDSEADLDAAVEGVTLSAFGYQGQKCSACSRAIVDAKVYDAFLEKLKARVEKITVGPPTDPENLHGAGDQRAARRSRFSPTSRSGRRKAAAAHGRRRGGGAGLLHPAHGHRRRRTQGARIAQEEIFGPVLAVIKAQEFRRRAGDRQRHRVRPDGRRLYQATAQKLRARGARSSSSATSTSTASAPARWWARTRSAASTCRGTDSKAGGQDYLLLFTQAKTVAEKVSA